MCILHAVGRNEDPFSRDDAPATVMYTVDEEGDLPWIFIWHSFTSSDNAS